MALGDNCASACRTRDHDSFGECLRGVKVAYCGVGGLDATAQKTWDNDLGFYRAARTQGVQPSGTSRGAVERALRLSDKHGKAYLAE